MKNQIKPDFTAIDKVLEIISIKIEPPKITDGEIAEQYTVESKKLFEILDKLINDGYVRKEINQTFKISEYFSTYEGSLLHQSGGYSELYNRQNREDKKNRYLTKMPIWISIIVALTGVVMSIISYKIYIVTKESTSNKQEKLLLKKQLKQLSSKQEIDELNIRLDSILFEEQRLKEVRVPTRAH